jgi:ankyrin repeat protein
MSSPEQESADDALRLHGVVLRSSAEPVSPDQLAQIETSKGLRLPAEYRSFLLRANGGIPEPRRFHYIVSDEDEGTRCRQKGKITVFYPASALEVPWGFPDWLLPIAQVEDALEGGMLCIALKGRKQGRIYYWPEQEIGEDKLHRVADSFNSLLALLGQKKTRSPGPATTGPKRRKLSLAKAAALGQVADVRRLLERGASPYTAHAYAADAGQAAVLRYLFESGALKEVGKDALNFTQPKLWEDLEVVRGHVKAGADVNHTFFDGTTPLHAAAEHGSPEVVRFLLERGATTGVWSRSLGQTALHRAVFDVRDAAALAKMKLLLDAGEDLHRRSGPVQPLAEYLSQRLGSVAAGLADLLGSALKQTPQVAASAAELLIAQGRAGLVHELERYLSGRRSAP